MRRTGLVLGAFALLLGTAAPSSAQTRRASIDEAREQWFAADFEASLASFEAVLARPELTSAEALDAHRYLAALSQLLGDEAGAREHAEAAVALDPAVEPPEGSPPSARDLFLMARRRIGGREAAVAVDAREPLELGASGTIVARVEPAPAALFDRLRLRCGDAEREGAPPTVELSLVPRGDVECTAEALGAGGAVLRTTERTFDLAEPRRRAWPWAVAGSVVVAAAVGTIVGVLVARDDGDPQLVGTTVVGW